MFKSLDQPAFLFGVLIAAYLIFQFFQIPYTIIAVDEFFFAHHIHQFVQHVPYRDFPPYKTILGYYLLSPLTLLSHDPVKIFFYIKDQIAVMNALFFILAASWGRRFFSMQAIFLTCAFVMASQLFLIYSVELRVDMLTCWVGLFSFFFILSERFTLAGFTIGLSFLVSQKALWFWAATDFALGMYWIMLTRDFVSFRKIIFFNLAAFIPIVIYVLFWASLSSVSIVLHSVFYEAYLQSKIIYYASIHHECWQAMLNGGPLFILLWPLTWISVFAAPQKNRILIALYAAALMLCVVTYQQPFPYNIVFLFPGLFFVYSDFITWILAGLPHPNGTQTRNDGFFGSKKILYFCFFYTIVLTGLCVYFDLLLSYYFIIFVPVLFAYFLRKGPQAIYGKLLVGVILYVGLICPLIRLIYINPYSFDGAYQQSMIRLGESLLQKDDSYIAGTPFLYNKNQAVLGLKNLIAPAIEYLYKPSPMLAPMLLDSLYMVPRTAQQVLQDLQKAPIKLYVNNFRIYYLPDTIKKYLAAHFKHYWGSIYLYAPTIERKQTVFRLKFDGEYQIESVRDVAIDHAILRPNATIHLRHGIHTVKATSDVRLVFVPNHIDLAPYAKYSSIDEWFFLLKKIVS
ncbi:MAG: hypothetical protein SFW66_08730 [Gammaproteobacteria bacterium]|nr:hypothetical protein [Gammaproteobacteria bacterium]